MYKGEDVIKKIRDYLGKTNPDESDPKTLRGKYGRIHTKRDNWHETVLHASDSLESAKREIELWFTKDELVE